ncbi:hypothetical protein AB0I28_13790 [Phytomonospora sp. NPDC050363]|uniref:hypothetical protein n=1 Tax=Phytomonospora sp. NPDC050363 TaxID=3155642 RepID=UPI0033F1104C
MRALTFTAALALLAAGAAAAPASASPVPSGADAVCDIETYPSAGTVARGGSGRTDVDTVQPGVPEDVTLAVSGAPAGVVAKTGDEPFLCGRTRSLDIEVAASAAKGVYVLTLVGTVAGGSDTTTYTLTVV